MGTELFSIDSEGNSATTVFILPDGFVEESEVFSVTLQLVDDLPNVVVGPAMTNVTILDTTGYCNVIHLKENRVARRRLDGLTLSGPIMSRFNSRIMKLDTP